MKVRVAVPALFSAPVVGVTATLTTGGASLSVMVAVAAPVPIVAWVALLKLTVKVSSFSSCVSLRIVTVTVWLCGVVCAPKFNVVSGTAV